MMDVSPLSDHQHLKSTSSATERYQRFSDVSNHHSNEGHCGNDLLNLTANLILPATPAREVSEFFDNLNNLDPVKFSPPGLSKAVMTPSATDLMADSKKSYVSLASSSPVSGGRYTRLEDFYGVDPTKQDPGTMDSPPKPPPKNGDKSKSMPHSQSESNIDFRLADTVAHKVRVGKIFVLNGERQRSSEDTDVTAVSSSFSRGRSITRTPSPAKVLEDIKEDHSPTPLITHTPRKRSRSPMKKLLGEMGRLGKSMSMKELPSHAFRKDGLKHWGGKVKERVEGLTGDHSNCIPIGVSLHTSPSMTSPSKTPPKSRFHVSLSPPFQAKLYSEIELMICATANQYLSVQKDEGRMSVESVTKITQYWLKKNRPQVIEFMFDQATQRDLVLYNLKTFRFYGPYGDNIISMSSMMNNWKALAREMSIRTFCAPDNVIRKHLHDCYKILEMLGAPLVTFLAFQEIQVKALKVMRDEQKKRDEHEAIKFGVERKWEPPARSSRDEELDNPFF